ncbi:MAG: hypothetical protein HUJ68_14070 [Clostridia bacterium]|nr:hypothetical protein [Clostridia bacterium]
MFKFEKISKYKDIDLPAPVRKTKGSACYDMVCAEDTIVYPVFRLLDNLDTINSERKITPEIKGVLKTMINDGKEVAAQELVDSITTCSIDEVCALTKETGFKPTLIPTGYKAQFPEGYSLDLHLRSSSALKCWLMMSNSVGIVDSDYYNNPDNEGHIHFMVINLLPFPVKIKKGEIIGQAKFVKCEFTDDDELFDKQERISGFGSTTKK